MISMRLEELFYDLYSNEGMYFEDEPDWNQLVISTIVHIIQHPRKEIVEYDKKISKRVIKNNNYRYKRIPMNRRLQTKRVRTHTRK